MIMECVHYLSGAQRTQTLRRRAFSVANARAPKLLPELRQERVCVPLQRIELLCFFTVALDLIIQAV